MSINFSNGYYYIVSCSLNRYIEATIDGTVRGSPFSTSEALIWFFGNYLSLSQKASEDVCASSNIIGPNATWVPEWRSTRSYFKSQTNKYLSMNKTLCVYCKEKRGGDFEEFELKPAASLESPFLPASYGSFPPKMN